MRKGFIQSFRKLHSLVPRHMTAFVARDCGLIPHVARSIKVVGIFETVLASLFTLSIYHLPKTVLSLSFYQFFSSQKAASV